MRSLFIIVFVGVFMIAYVNSQVPRGQQNRRRRQRQRGNTLSNPGGPAPKNFNQNAGGPMPKNFNQNAGGPMPKNFNQNAGGGPMTKKFNQNPGRPRPKQQFSQNQNQNQWQNQQQMATTPGMGGNLGPIFGDLFNAIVEERVRGLRQDDKLQELQTEVTILRTQVGALTKEISIAKPLSQQLDELIQKKSRRVAFSAELKKSGDKYLPGTTIVFDSSTINHGNGYNNTSGIFSAPVDGLYLFSAFIIAESKGYHSQILKNGSPIGYMYTHNTDTWGSSSTTVLSNLRRGDKVWVNSYDGSRISNWSTFSGFLIQ